jgi:hypothetical protein
MPERRHHDLLHGRYLARLEVDAAGAVVL